MNDGVYVGTRARALCFYWCSIPFCCGTAALCYPSWPSHSSATSQSLTEIRMMWTMILDTNSCLLALMVDWQWRVHRIICHWTPASMLEGLGSKSLWMILTVTHNQRQSAACSCVGVLFVCWFVLLLVLVLVLGFFLMQVTNMVWAYSYWYQTFLYSQFLYSQCPFSDFSEMSLECKPEADK